MPRPSRNIDKRLLKAGKELVPNLGFSGLTVRAIACRAGVNLGMFNYHFKTRERFIESLLAEVYEEFLAAFTIQIPSGVNSFEQLKTAILSIAMLIKKYRKILIPVIIEVIQGNTTILDFASRHMTKHVKILYHLVTACRKDGYIIKAPVPVVMAGIAGIIGVPNMMVHVGERNPRIAARLLAGALEPLLLSDAAIATRVDILMRGLSTGMERV